LQEDTDNSYDYIVLFAELVRNTLNYSQKDFIPIEKEIDFLNVYLTLEKLRFKEALTFEISHSGASNISVPSLLIQPFIENAILHGLLHKKGSKNIVVKFTFNKDLICEITDNGIGREASKKIKSRKGKNHESFSLSAIDNRLKIFNAQGSNNVYYQIEDLYENDSPIGTKATIKMPFKREF
jgi:LytS/YehU family sensor histidine kinase